MTLAAYCVQTRGGRYGQPLAIVRLVAAYLVQLLLTAVKLGVIGHGVQAGGAGVIGVDGNDLPVRLALVDHGQAAQDLDLVHAPHGHRGGAELHKVDGVGVPNASCRTSAEVCLGGGSKGRGGGGGAWRRL